MKKFFLVMFIFIHAQMSWALVPEECNPTTAPVTEQGDRTTGYYFLERLQSLAPNSTISPGQWEQYNYLLEESQKKFGKSRLSITVKRLCELHPAAAKQDPVLRSIPGPFQQFDVELENHFRMLEIGSGKLMLVRSVFIKGKVIASPSCKSLFNCSRIYQFYVDEIGSKTQRAYQVGAETGAGG